MFSKQWLYRTTGHHHAQIEVIEQNVHRYLRFGSRGGWQGAIHMQHPNRIVFAYQRAFHGIASALELPATFLSFGVGTGTSLQTMHRLWPRCELHGVELDEKVIDVAIRYFGSPNESLAHYHVRDGIDYLCQTDVAFDVIFVDAYLSNRIHGPILDPAFAHILHKSVSNSGVVVVNVISRIPFSGRLMTLVDEAANLFSEISFVPVGPWFTEQNVMVIFSNQPGFCNKVKRAFRAGVRLNLLERCTWPVRTRIYSSR